MPAFDPHAFDDLITAACREVGLSIPLVRAQAQHESGWNPLAVGDGGRALGLMQAHKVAAEDVGMAGTWDDLKTAIEAGDQREAARLSLKIGCAYLAKLLKRFGGQEGPALGAYNQGPTVIAAAIHYADSVLALKGKV